MLLKIHTLCEQNSLQSQGAQMAIDIDLLANRKDCCQSVDVINPLEQRLFLQDRVCVKCK